MTDNPNAGTTPEANQVSRSLDAQKHPALSAEQTRSMLDAMVKHMTDDVITQFGNQAEICGKAAFRTLFNQVGQAISGLRHDILDLWHAVEDFDVWVVQLNVSYRLLDGRTITLPCCNVFRMRGELICEYRVYMDIGPVLDGAAARGV